MVGRVARGLEIVLASAGVVLLVACANVANLFLVRSESRQRDIAVRRALGASRGDIATYFLAETVWLGAAGAAVGLALASAGVRLLVRFGPESLPRLGEVRLDWVAIGFTLAVAAITALLFGTMPLLRRSPLAQTLHHGARTLAGSGGHLARHAMMGAQVALALMLLIASGLMIRSFQNLRAIDPGFDARSAFTFTIGLPDRDYPTRDRAVAAHQRILDRLRALPGVSSRRTSRRRGQRRRQLRTRAHGQLGVDARKVVLDCLLGQEQRRCDLLVRPARRHQGDDLALAGR
jgi:hypothetical protein